MEQHAVARLIGAPPGYVGHDEGGQLTETVRRRPYSVILMDEIEKAHPQVLNILLQVLDDGRLTDGKGRTVDFSNTVIIMTSNVGSEYLQVLAEAEARSVTGLTTPPNENARVPPKSNLSDSSTGGVIPEAVKDNVMRSLKAHFRPEFLNRLDDIILFHPLTRNTLRSIVALNLASLNERLKSQRDITLEVDRSGVDEILKISYDPLYGARPLRRFLEKKIVTRLSRLILSGEVKDHCVVRISAGPNHGGGVGQKLGDGDFVFNVEQNEVGSDTASDAEMHVD
jgi:ATP-dependent Clp protease ATP-binding subunit ClpB